MGKKSVKTGSVLGYLWMLVGLLVLAVCVLVHLEANVPPVTDSVSFLAGEGKATFRFIGMAVGALLIVIGFWNKPRKKESK